MSQSPRIKTTHRLKLVALAAFAGAMVMAACGDDDDGVTPPASVDGGQDGGGDETSEDSGDGGDGGGGGDATDALVIFDAPGDDVEAATRQDAAKLEAGAPCQAANPCDCDNDGYEAEGGTCAGNDCDDRDGLRHPNQTYVIEPPDPGKDGNWDCVNPIQKQYVEGLDCSTLLGLNCNTSAQGFTAKSVACGEEADYYQCQQSGLACVASKMGKRRQGCK